MRHCCSSSAIKSGSVFSGSSATCSIRILYSPPRLAALCARVVDEDAAHQAGRRAEKVRAVLPAYAALVYEL